MARRTVVLRQLEQNLAVSAVFAVTHAEVNKTEQTGNSSARQTPEKRPRNTRYHKAAAKILRKRI